MFAPITLALNNLLEQLKQISTTNTSSHSTTKAIRTIQIDIDINIVMGIQNTIAMVIATETNHTVKIHTIEHITVDTAIGKDSMK